MKTAAEEALLERAARLFRALGDVPRLRLISLLAQGEACVTTLAAAENEQLSTISQRLRVLRAENIVVGRRRGKEIHYALADQHMVKMIFNALEHATEAGPGRVNSKGARLHGSRASHS